MTSVNFIITNPLSSFGPPLHRNFTIKPSDADLATVSGSSSDSYYIDTVEDIPNSVFTSDAAAISHFLGVYGQGLVDNINSALGVMTYTLGVVEPFSEPLNTFINSKVDKVTGFGLSTNDYTSAEKTKLSGIATGATANQTDVYLLDRAHHSGAQAISTVTGLQTALDSKQSSITPATHITNAATNAADNNLTNYNLVSGILGVANGLNAANANQNVMADNLNDLATKFNTLLSELQIMGILHS